MSEGQDALLAEARDYLQALCPASTGHDINVALNKFADTSNLEGKDFALALQTHIQRRVFADLRCKPGESKLRESVFPDKRLVQVSATEQVAGETVTHNYYGGGDVGNRGNDREMLEALRRIVAANTGANAGNANNANRGRDQTDRDEDYRDTIAYRLRGNGTILTDMQAARALQEIKRLRRDEVGARIPLEYEALSHFTQYMDEEMRDGITARDDFRRDLANARALYDVDHVARILRKSEANRPPNKRRNSKFWRLVIPQIDIRQLPALSERTAHNYGSLTHRRCTTQFEKV